MTTTTQLIGKAGVGLTMFHLARHGIDFVATVGDSHVGDLWVKAPHGRILSIEVKTCLRGTQWLVNVAQATRVDAFVFVEITTGRSWVVSREDVLRIAEAISACRSFSIRARTFPVATEEGWELLGGKPTALARPRGLPRQLVASGKIQSVRKRLANGSIKEYRYDRGSRELVGAQLLQ